MNKIFAASTGLFTATLVVGLALVYALDKII